jgi:hypothetical protein
LIAPGSNAARHELSTVTCSRHAIPTTSGRRRRQHPLDASLPTSHGCIRITTAAMDRLSDRLPVGTPMLVYRR